MRKHDSDLLNYIAENSASFAERQTQPLDQLSEHLGISTGKLREQLEVARAIGIVEVTPKTGIRLTEYNFTPAVRFSLLYALSQDHTLFDLV